MAEERNIATIETDRLLLIPYYVDYIAATMTSHQRLEQLCGYQVAPEWPGIDFLFYLPFALEQLKENPADAKWTRLIVLKETQEVIGEIGGQGTPSETKVVELGYSTIPRCQNKGYMTEAIAAICKWFVAEGMQHIRAKCFMYNTASKHVLQNNGFELDYCEKDVIYWHKPIGGQ